MNDNTYQIITCPSNVAAILYNNKDLQSSVKVISINNTGLLYIVTTDPSIQSLEDLRGRTVYSIGEGGPPEYTFEYLMEKTGMSSDVNLSFRSTPFEVVNLLQDEANSIALLPQPFVEVAKLLVENLNVPIDITAQWDAWNTDSKAESITTVSIVRTDFLEEHEQAVVEYLKLAKQSTDYTLSHVEEAAAWTEEFETFLNPEVAVDAIPQCNICTLTGEKMKEKLGGFIDIMYNFNPDAVGGAIPDDDFYYIPPEE
jgi:NitT/TauT family transport system substrate-binding protein